MSKRLCNIHGLWNKTDKQSGCPRCNRVRQKTYDKYFRDKDTTKFYKSKNWLELRQIVLIDEPICRKCKRNKTSDIDHIIPIKKGGKFYPLAWDIAKLLSHKYELKDEKIWIQDKVGLAPYGYPYSWTANILHHYCIILRKEND